MASGAGGDRSPANLIPAMTSPPAAAMASKTVEVRRIVAGSMAFSFCKIACSASYGDCGKDRRDAAARAAGACCFPPLDEIAEDRVPDDRRQKIARGALYGNSSVLARSLRSQRDWLPVL